MRNVELKVSINNFDKITSLLRKIRAKHVNKQYQRDIYYYCGNGRLKVRNINNKKFELIFYQRPNRTGEKISNYQIFRIKPKEINFTTSVLDKKFGEQIIVEKNREVWIYKHTRIHIDEVFRLGNFLELETVIKNINTKKAEKEFKEVVKLLDLRKYKKHSKSYSDLLLRNLKVNQIKLENFSPLWLSCAGSSAR